MEEKNFKPYQAVYGSYKGKKIFEVTHPAFGTCRVSAPDAIQALWLLQKFGTSHGRALTSIVSAQFHDSSKGGD